MCSLKSTEKLYKANVTYFERPLLSNYGYDFDVVQADSPYDITVSIKDETNEQFKGQLKQTLDKYLDFIRNTEKQDAHEKLKIAPDLFYVGMPVIVKVQDVTNAALLSIARGEVVYMENNELDIILVDNGGQTVKLKEEVLPITVDCMRIPKLGVQCRMGLIRPDKGPQWPRDRDYVKDFTGGPNSCRKITLVDFNPDSFTYEASFDVDKVNVAIKYFHEGLATPVPLEVKPGVKGKFPTPEFISWIGLKVIVFGLKVYRDTDHQDKIKCVLQMEPESVNSLQEKIKTYAENATEAERKAPFVDSVGSPCLALFEGEYYRATILRKEIDGKYFVEYVDYCERQIVSLSEMMKIPPQFLDIVEGAVVCQLTDILMSNFDDVDKLRDLIENQDLYAVIDACDPEMFGSELLVSLFQPDVSFCGPNRSFGEILGVSERPPEVRNILQVMEPVPEGWEDIYLVSQPPASNNFFPGVVVTVINNWDSLWIQLPDAAERSAMISAELIKFYSYGGCLEEERADFLQNNITGKYVVATVPEEVEDGEDDFLYRAKVMEEREEQLLLFYLDYGNSDWVEKKSVYPLHKYFLKDPLTVIEVAVKF